MVNETVQVVTIAGSDSGGGAGLQADLKTFQARDTFGMSIIVALTAQNTKGVQGVFPVSTNFVTEQFNSLADDMKIRAAKTGMLGDEEHIKNVAANIKRVDFGYFVVDPVMVAKGGYKLLDPSASKALIEHLIPLADVITPNIPEAEAILDRNIKTSTDMIEAAQALQAYGCKNVIIKGGHGKGNQSIDYVLLADGTHFWMSSPRVDTERTHGTGDTFSACITAELAKGADMTTAIKTAKAFIQGAIAQGIQVGNGHGPTNHWATLSEDVEYHDDMEFEL